MKPGKLLVNISACLILSLAVITVLFFKAFYVQNSNGFKRKWVNADPLIIVAKRDLTVNSYYVSGISKNHIYLGNYSAPDHLLAYNFMEDKTTQLKFKVEFQKSMRKSEMFARVDSPYVYLLEGTSPVILSGSLNGRNLTPFLNKLPYFSSHVGFPVSSSSFVLKIYDQQKKQYVLSKVMGGTPYMLKRENTLQKQIDGIFCTDGLLLKDQKNTGLWYVYFYRNQIIGFDTALNVTAKRNTIDTNRMAKIHLAKITSDDKITFSSPPLMVNRTAYVYNSYLYVNSQLNAENEQHNAFKKNSVIDIYNLRNGSYLHSFYLPDLGGKKIKEIVVSENRLLILQDHFLIQYQINTNY